MRHVLLGTLVVPGLLCLGCSATVPTEPAALPESTARPTPSAAPAPARTGPADPGHPYEAPLTSFKVKLKGVTTARSVHDRQWGTHRPDGKYVLVRLSLRNLTKRPVHPPVHLPLTTSDGSEYLPSWEPTFGQTVLAGRGDLGPLNPGATTDVVIVFDLPRSARPVGMSGIALRVP